MFVSSRANYPRSDRIIKDLPERGYIDISLVAMALHRGGRIWPNIHFPILQSPLHVMDVPPNEEHQVLKRQSLQTSKIIRALTTSPTLGTVTRE